MTAGILSQTLLALDGGNDSYTKALLHMDGTDDAQVFTESALGVSHTWTARGTAKTENTQSKFGGTSLFVDNTGNTGANAIDTPDSADWTLGSSNWTIDFWFYNSGGSQAFDRYFFGNHDSSAANKSVFAYLAGTTNVITAKVTTDGSTATTVTATTAFSATGWHHCAFVRTGNTLKLFIDGTQEGGDVAFSSSIFDAANVLAVGRAGAFTTGNGWIGYIDEFRISVGIARWTATFTPPAFPYR